MQLEFSPLKAITLEESFYLASYTLCWVRMTEHSIIGDILGLLSAVSYGLFTGKMYLMTRDVAL